MLSRFAHFLLRRNRNAAIVSFLCSILPMFLGSISVIIVALVTLRNGAKAGFFVLAWGGLPLLAEAFVTKSYLLLMTVVSAFVLVWGMALVLRYCSSWGVLLEISVVLSIGVVLASLAFQSQIEQWWLGHINAYMDILVDENFIQTDEKLSQDQVLNLARMSTGVEVLLLLLLATLKLAIARWWELSVFKKIKFRQELLKTRLDRWVLIVFVFLGLASVLSQKIIFLTALIPVAGFYVVAGLCALHAWMQGYKYASLALLGFYIVLILCPYVVALPLLLGLIDSGLNLRVKLIKKEV